MCSGNMFLPCISRNVLFSPLEPEQTKCGCSQRLWRSQRGVCSGLGNGAFATSNCKNDTKVAALAEKVLENIKKLG